MRQPSKTATVVAVSALLIAFIVGVASARGLAPSMLRYLIAGGGGRSSGGGLVMRGSVGQPLTDASSGGNRRLAGGFWPGLVAVATTEPTPSHTATATPTATATSTATHTPTGTATQTPTQTGTATLSPTSSPSATTTETPTATSTTTTEARWAYLPLVHKP